MDDNNNYDSINVNAREWATLRRWLTGSGVFIFTYFLRINRQTKTHKTQQAHDGAA